jgi:hypothetical protein
MRATGCGLLIADPSGSSYFTSVTFTFLWNLKVMFYYFSQLPRLDKALNFEHAIYFDLLMILRTNTDFLLKRNYWYGVCNRNVVPFIYIKNSVSLYWHYLSEIHDLCTWIYYHKFKKTLPRNSEYILHVK